MLAGLGELLPKRLGVLEAPKAGVLDPPNKLEAEEAPKAGVLAPNKEGVLAAPTTTLSVKVERAHG